ncbi:conserved hypothetical protein [Gammaproteobacteria bacterium]
MTPDLSQLHDIHLPAPISWWPPALGWWLLAFLVSVLIGLGVWLLRRHRAERWRRTALAELAQLRRRHQAGTVTAHDTVRSLSVLLRRVALTRFPRSEVASLNGEAWLTFLDGANGPLRDEQPFQKGIGRVLVATPYMATAQVKAEELLKLAERWCKALPGDRRRP